jgi:hypothetical protein
LAIVLFICTVTWGAVVTPITTCMRLQLKTGLRVNVNYCVDFKHNHTQSEEIVGRDKRFGRYPDTSWDQMDGLSVAASIIAVLQAANAVVSVCYDYRAAVKDSSWELPRVTEEVKGLRNVLETLESLASDLEKPGSDAKSRLPTLQLLCKPKTGNEGGLLAMCLEELNNLKKKLAPPKWAGSAGSKRLAVTQALRWPLKESETNKTLESIGRFRDMLTLALTADQT